jgi:formylglycine-generating enzyme required for sulfatase activity
MSWRRYTTRNEFPSRELRTMFVFAALMLVRNVCSANDIQLTNVSSHPYSGGASDLEFDISWLNSWRATAAPHNWDAAWVFCKIRRNNGAWQHLKLSATGHIFPSSPIPVSASLGLVDTQAPHDPTENPVVGIFLYRANDGSGTFTANDVRLRWNYADNGASSSDFIEIRVFAIEMVYVPQGAFYAGDGSPTTGAAFRQGSSDYDPWHITSEGILSTTSGSPDGFFYVGAGSPGESTSGDLFDLNSGFPKGFGAFYIMKGELSQGQWVAFFNTLTTPQKSTRDITSNDPISGGKASDELSFRNNVSWILGDATLTPRAGGATYSGVAMNWLSWADLGAYLDWSGLRPMSELEFEKSARGTVAPVGGELAWGDGATYQATTILNDGLNNERGNIGSNLTYSNSVSGPLRVGSFSQGVSTRVASGAGFYGAMDLSSNVWERAVSVGNSSGRSFRGRYHGDGLLDSNGNLNVTTWPVPNVEEPGFRGGSFSNNYPIAQISNRANAAKPLEPRSGAVGGRGVRSMP